VAAYFLQQKQEAPITQGDGALVGLLAGIAGSFVYLIVSIPMTLLAPMEREVLHRVLEDSRMPPEVRAWLGTSPGSGSLIIIICVMFVFMLIVGAIFSTLGGLLGAVIFRKPLPPPASDAAPPQPS